MSARIPSRPPPRARPGKKIALVSLRASKTRPHVRNWLQSFLLDGVF